MAILDAVPGIEVTVQINGQAAVEYDDPDAAELNETCPTSSKYIECIDEAEFSIQHKVTSPYKWGYKNHCLSFQSQADGMKLASRLLKEDKSRNTCMTHTKSAIEVDACNNREIRWKCRFSSISTVDDSRHERMKEDAIAAKSLGLIQITVYRVIYTHKTHPTSSHFKPNKLEFSEKSLKGKAISHGVSKVVALSRVAKTSTVDRGPIAVFRFHYRSKESLKRELIIPRSSPVPQSPAGSPSLSNMPREEVERLARERLDQLRVKSEVKREPRSVVKRESQSRVKREATEVFDLTQDDVDPRPKKLPKREAEVIELSD